MKNTQEVKQETEKDWSEIHGSAINTALEMDVAFKLYSHRIIGHEQFIARVLDLSTYFCELHAKEENFKEELEKTVN